MLIFDTLARCWVLCVVLSFFLGSICLMLLKVRLSFLDLHLPARLVFWCDLILWFLLLSFCLFFVDNPHVGWDKITLDWFFMFSAFLGIPVAAPLAAMSVWALCKVCSKERVRLFHLFFVGMMSFSLACAASNIHDVLWCGVITNWYAEHHKAGHDLDLFGRFAQICGVPGDTAWDYAVLGPVAMVLVFWEIVAAGAALRRLTQSAG